MQEAVKICKKVAKLRTRNNLSITELSQLSGVSRRTLSRIEAESRIDKNDPSQYSPKLETITALARAMRYHLGEFVSTPQKQLVALVN
jgi:transcriptional regulator with XRE-family HTH domain